MTTTFQRPAIRLACRPFPPQRLLLPSVHLFDPSSGLDQIADISIDDGYIAAIEEHLVPPPGARVLHQLAGCYVFPGFVDIHTHLRTPGQEYKEDIASATTAAAAGGYVIVVGMANTDPPVDCGPLLSWVLDQAENAAVVLVGQVGTVSKDRSGSSLSELRELAEAGAAGFSDDGSPIDDPGLLLAALRYLRGVNRPIMLHLEDRGLASLGHMHEGKWSARLGLRGIPSCAESAPLARDLEVVAYAAREFRAVRGEQASGCAQGARWGLPLVHFQHISSKESVRLLGEALGAGLPISCEVTPHHLLMTDEALQTYDQNLKTNPPLRSESDREALVQALAQGVISCIATDHAPHAPHEKEVPFEEALPGTIGLETAFPALYAGLVAQGHLDLERLIDAMSTAPCRVLGLEPPRLAVGAPARLCVVDLGEEWTVAPPELHGKARNSAFLGQKVKGRVLLTIVDGSIRFAHSRVGEMLVHQKC